MTDAEKAAQAAAEAKAKEEADAKAKAEAGAKEVAAMRERLAALEAEVKETRGEAAKYRTRAKEIEEARKREEEQRLAAEGKWQPLAEARAKEIEDLRKAHEAVAAKAKSYEEREAAEAARRDAQIKAEFSKLPEAVRQALPSDIDTRTMQIVLAARGVAPVSAAPPVPAAPPPTPPVPGGGPKVWTEAEIEGLTPSEFQKVEAEIRKALAEGRVQTRNSAST